METKGESARSRCNERESLVDLTRIELVTS
jgi:hypothetical protein